MAHAPGDAPLLVARLECCVGVAEQTRGNAMEQFERGLFSGLYAPTPQREGTDSDEDHVPQQAKHDAGREGHQQGNAGSGRTPETRLLAN